jgi:ureidoacrylate peracid hydrolase
MGYNVIFLTDANAALSDEEHNATLMSMTAIFADVMDSNRLVQLIARSQALPLAG